MSRTNSNLSIKKRAKTFYFASLFFSRNKQNDIKTLYIFCRYVDDIGDSNVYSTREKKHHLKKIKKDLLEYRSKDRIVSNFIFLLSKYKIKPLIAIDLVDGVLGDLKKVDISNIDKLILYGYKVAGTVGLIMCKIMELNNKYLERKGIQLGIAMQITNISRDIKEDLERNRIYIPKEFRSINTNKASEILKNKTIQTQLSSDLKKLIDLSDEIYSTSWDGVIGLPLKYRIPIAIASKLYQSIGQKIRKNNYNIWRKRIYLSLNEKIFKTISVFIELLFINRDYKNNLIENKINQILAKQKSINCE